MTTTRSTVPTKRRLQDSAIDLIADHGLAALSVRTLCRAVGIRESSFYAHFPSKDALLEELLQHAGAEAPLRLAERLDAADLPLAEFVRQLVAQLAQLWTEPHGRKLRVLLETEVARDPARREQFNTRVLGMIATVARTLQRYLDEGALAPHAPADVLAWSLVAPIAAMRFSLFAHGASDAHVAHGLALAQAHADAWSRAHASPRPSHG